MRYTVHLGDGHVEVQVKAENSPGEKNDKDAESRILEIRHLNFHTSELYSPANRRIDRGRFEADSLPIRRLYVLEMIHGFLVVLTYRLAELNKGVADE